MSAANAPDSSTLGHVLWNWFSNSTASTSDESATQIKCYAFPYGFLGFLAHLAMFYGIALSSFNRCPWKFNSPLEHSRRDLVFGIIGLVISCLLTAGTMYRCSGTQYYVLIASSKILTTVASSAIGIHIAWNIRGRGKKKEIDLKKDRITHHNALKWLIVEVVGSILEFTGVIMLLEESHDAAVKNKTPIMVMSLFLAGFMGISLGVGIAWLEVRQHGQRRMEWEIRKVQIKCTALEERLAPEEPRGRSLNRRRGAPNRESRAEESRNLGPRQEGRRAGSCDAVRDPRRNSLSPVIRVRDLEAQRLIVRAGEDEADKEPILYYYKDILNSAKQVVLVAGATFGFFVTLYTDWILAAVSGSYWGFPTTGNVGMTVVYVIFYFVVRLMPVLSA
ncbi:hypothetical protein N8I77_008267 [Diaporthe amygdali]|uniref:Uncharacterized protein n=1 Tax=Phomopsis amygdali TaxID=1214568 RepID=A0AAD9SET2_PHOAM|nr:hypothetical protein N8I77_008267 [Diaporthe amygdali]